MKKILSIVVVFSLILSLGTPAFASSNSSIDSLYTKYTIDFTTPTARTVSNDESRINKAISFVKSLGLEGTEFSYIEEACLQELDSYKISGIVLESYSVLVPKSKAEAMTYYGTYLGSDFYSSITSESSFRIETNGETNEDNSNNWMKWVNGTIDLLLVVSDLLEYYDIISAGVPTPVALGFSAVSSILGYEGYDDVYTTAHNCYVEQFDNVKTRTIFKENGSSYKMGYQDQECSYRLNWYFCPVGLDFGDDFIFIKTIAEGDGLWSTDFDKNTILSVANTYANHNGAAIYSIRSMLLGGETWG